MQPDLTAGEVDRIQERVGGSPSLQRPGGRGRETGRGIYLWGGREEEGEGLLCRWLYHYPRSVYLGESVLYEVTGTERAKYVLANGRGIAKVVTGSQYPGTYYPHRDHPDSSPAGTMVCRHGPVAAGTAPPVATPR
ncbi:MAG: hypothetical protein ACUVRM_02645 [Bacillota bacterium]